MAGLFVALNYSLMAAWQACNRPGVSRSFDATTAVPLEAEYPELAAKGMKKYRIEKLWRTHCDGGRSSFHRRYRLR